MHKTVTKKCMLSHKEGQLKISQQPDDLLGDLLWSFLKTSGLSPSLLKSFLPTGHNTPCSTHIYSVEADAPVCPSSRRNKPITVFARGGNRGVGRCQSSPHVCYLQVWKTQDKRTQQFCFSMMYCRTWGSFPIKEEQLYTTISIMLLVYLNTTFQQKISQRNQHHRSNEKMVLSPQTVLSLEGDSSKVVQCGWVNWSWAEWLRGSGSTSCTSPRAPCTHCLPQRHSEGQRGCKQPSQPSKGLPRPLPQISKAFWVCTG